ncbi:MAG TPA: hypothetical protein PLW77_10425 [Bacteroidales bacterium]|nr:hypothetical protein [Bacteroidales bacterium]HQB21115.1 hypothetical protein [Bacteroidales bacterium]
MNAVWGSIIENLRAIEIVLEKTPESFTTDRIQTSNGREYTIQEFVSRYFPQTYLVKKGPIYSLTSCSSEIDCVILAPNHPKLTTPIREVIIAEGVHAAIELKPDISNLSDAEGTEIKRALKQIQSVKKLERKVIKLDISLPGQRNQNPYFDKIPTFLFSFVSKPVKEIIEFLVKQVKVGVYDFEDFPDFIVTLDNGVLFYTPYAKECMYKKMLNNTYSSFPNNLFLHFPLDKAESLAMFLIALYSVNPPEILVSDFILKNYLGHFPKGFSCQPIGIGKPNSEASTIFIPRKKLNS